MTAANRTPLRLSLTTTAATENAFHTYTVRTGRLWEISYIVCEFGTSHASNLVNIVHDTNGKSGTTDSNTSTTLVDAVGAFGTADAFVSHIVTNDVAGFEYMLITSHTDTVLTGVWVDAGDPTSNTPAYTTWMPIFDEYGNFTRATFDPRTILGRPIILETTQKLRIIFARGGASSTVTSTIYGNERNI